MKETQNKKVVIFVPAPEIDRLILRFGRSDHSPIFSMSLGIILVLIGLYGLIGLFEDPAAFRYETGAVALGLLGGSLIFDTLKKRYFLEVHKKKGISRLVFSKNARLKDIQDFLHKVSTIYKFQITDELVGRDSDES